MINSLPVLLLLLLSVISLPALSRGNPISFIKNTDTSIQNNNQLKQVLSAYNKNSQQAREQSFIKSLKVNNIIQYQNKKYKIIKNKNNLIYLCPYYTNNFYNSHNWGWFYNKDCLWIDKLTLAKNKYEKQTGKFASQKDLEKQIPWSKINNKQWLASRSVPEFQHYFKTLKDIVVTEPTPRNMQAYMSMQDMARRKSVVFAHSMVNFVLDHPEYNMQKNFGSNGWSYRTLKSYHSTVKKRYLTDNSGRVGIYLLIKGSCPYCNQQEKVLNWLSADYNLTTVLVTKDYCPAGSKMTCVVDPDLSKLFHIKYFPTTVMVYKRSNGKPAFQPIGSGLINEEQLSNRLYYYTKIIKAVDSGNHNPYMPVQTLTQNININRGLH